MNWPFSGLWVVDGTVCGATGGKGEGCPVIVYCPVAPARWNADWSVVMKVCCWYATVIRKFACWFRRNGWLIRGTKAGCAPRVPRDRFIFARNSESSLPFSFSSFHTHTVKTDIIFTDASFKISIENREYILYPMTYIFYNNKIKYKYPIDRCIKENRLSNKYTSSSTSFWWKDE